MHHLHRWHLRKRHFQSLFWFFEARLILLQKIRKACPGVRRNAQLSIFDSAASEMSAKFLNRTALSSLRRMKNDWTSRRTVTELSTRNDQVNGKQNETLDPAQSKFSLLNENSLSRQVLNYSRTKTRKTLETKSYGDQEFEVIQINFRNWIVFNEQNEFVNKLVACLSKELNVDREEAKRYFFNLNSLTGREMNNLFGRADVLERSLRATKRYLTDYQLINNDFELIKNFQRRFLCRMSILQLIGIELPSTLNQLNFSLIFGQTEQTLKQLNLLKSDSSLVDRVLSQLSLSEHEKQRAKSNCGPTDDLEVFEILNRLSEIYLQIRLNWSVRKITKKRLFYKLNRLDLLNVDKVLNFIDSLKIKNSADKFCQIEKSRMNGIFSLNSYELAEIDEFLKANDLQFVWRHFFTRPYLFADPGALIGKLNRLNDFGVSKQLLAKHFFLLYYNVGKLEFFLAKFGSSFFDYPDLKQAFYKYEQIVKKAGELTDQQLKSHTFSQFMSEHV